MSGGEFMETFRRGLAKAGMPVDAAHGWSEPLPRLPEALADLYRLAARHPLNHMHHRLLLPHELERHEQRTVFVRENQDVVVWAYDTDDWSEDPLVWQGHPQPGSETIDEWHAEEATISEFILSMWQWLTNPEEWL